MKIFPENHTRQLIIISIFAIAMGFLEAAVVYYIRMLYYPEGFSFPLKSLELHIAAVEIVREIATLLMLITVAYLTGKRLADRFAWFIYCFALWDIFYYVFLYVTLGWPQSLLTWDVLFLIPLTWVGPVLAPLINSFMMILLAFVILHKMRNSTTNLIGIISWLMLIAGSLIVIYGYVEEYTRFMMQHYSLTEVLFPGSKAKEILALAVSFIPGQFDWYIFGAGTYLHLNAIARIYRRQPGRKDKW
jgi:hypothetical protein